MGFESENLTLIEGEETVDICITILSPNETVLNQSNIHGQFYFQISNGNCDVHNVFMYVFFLFFFYSAP